jgi:hypothetical protein
MTLTMFEIGIVNQSFKLAQIRGANAPSENRFGGLQEQTFTEYSYAELLRLGLRDAALKNCD